MLEKGTNDAPPALDTRLQESVFNQLWRDYEGYIRQVVSSFHIPEPDVDDIAQNVAIILYRKGGTFRGGAQWKTWLHRVTVNATLAYLEKVRATRRAELHNEPLLKEATSGKGDPVAETCSAECRDRLYSAVDTLHPDYRIVFVLADFEDYSNATIADILSMNVEAVKTRLHRARQKLKELLRSA